MTCSLCQNPRLPWSIALHAHGASFPSNRLVFNEIVAYQEQAWATTAMTKETRKYRKIPKISPGAYVFQRPFLRGLFIEGLIFGGAYLRREIDWGSLIVEGWVEGKFTVFALFYFVFEGNFPSTSPRGAYIWWDDLTVALPVWGAYFRNFTVIVAIIIIIIITSHS